MASPNINLRDPVMYRVRHATHHRTGDQWCIYPMYSWAHPVEDALEGITHSICTLEFEDQRPFYDWILTRLAELGKLSSPLPHQYEFARLEPHLRGHQQAQAAETGERRPRRRLGRPAHAYPLRPAPARLHARLDPPVLRPHGGVQVRLAHRLQPARAGRAR